MGTSIKSAAIMIAAVMMIMGLGVVTVAGANGAMMPEHFHQSVILESDERPHIQIAILLDTSGSMSGLIHQAQTQLWKIINEFNTVKKNGVTPVLQVSLYQYGSSRLPAKQGYMKQILPLTTDLDMVSEKLFALTSSGSEEYCGQVISRAADDLKWSGTPGDLKMIFIAGNEPFTQGPVDYGHAVKSAISRGIVVNTIYCGNFQEGIAGKWKDGALLADGHYLHIDHNSVVVHIDAPQDKLIAHLGVKLNDTYIPYGSRGSFGVANQMKQDSNAKSVGSGILTQRAVTKANANYVNDSWDLVDATKNGSLKLDEVKEKDLPDNMQSMTLAERNTYIEEKKKERDKISKEIAKLNKEREAYVAKKRKEMAGGKEDTLDSAITKVIKSLLKAKKFEITMKVQ